MERAGEYYYLLDLQIYRNITYSELREKVSAIIDSYEARKPDELTFLFDATGIGRAEHEYYLPKYHFAEQIIFTNDIKVNYAISLRNLFQSKYDGKNCLTPISNDLNKNGIIEKDILSMISKTSELGNVIISSPNGRTHGDIFVAMSMQANKLKTNYYHVDYTPFDIDEPRTNNIMEFFQRISKRILGRQTVKTTDSDSFGSVGVRPERFIDELTNFSPAQFVALRDEVNRGDITRLTVFSLKLLDYDPHYSAIINRRMGSLNQLRSYLHYEDKNSDIFNETYRLIKSSAFDDLISQMSSAIPVSFAVSEIIWRVKDNIAMPCKFIPIKPYWFNLTPCKRNLLLKENYMPFEGRELKRSKFVVHKANLGVDSVVSGALGFHELSQFLYYKLVKDFGISLMCCMLLQTSRKG